MRHDMENHRMHTLLWIVRQLEEQPLSLRELNERWKREVGLSGGLEIERRTFLNHLHAIDDMLHISIECERKGGYRYFIADREKSSLNRWMLENFRQQLALSRGMGLEERILMDEAPEGHEWLELLVDAMTQGRKVGFIFKDFNIEGPWEVEGAPYALRCYQQRWYVVLKEEDGYVDTYSLDRIMEMTVLEETFEMDPSFSAKDYFRYSCGVRVNPEAEPTRVLLKVSRVQRGYLKTLRLHSSQEELETYPDYSLFKIDVVPTVELVMKLLSMGSLVEVLEPQELREEMAREAKSMARMYDKVDKG